MQSALQPRAPFSGVLGLGKPAQTCRVCLPVRRRLNVGVEAQLRPCAGTSAGTLGGFGPASPLQRKSTQRKLVVTSSQSGGKAEDAEKQDWKFGRNEGPMTWPWKLMCAILYMLPWVDVTEKTVYFVERFPAFIWTEYFSEPFEHWYNIHEYAPLFIFFATYLGIVRNKKIPHVARYHVMMGVMLDIVAMILIVTEENLPTGVLWTPWSDLFYALMFWFIFLLVVYCLFFCFLGWYCEIPLISEGVYLQIEQAEQLGA
ncbi:Protein TIC 20-II, chloroplastic [Pleodorina starrii]|uniref:Protein TIC 20 n=1 Tax=Pleodorina starrii TaxID=330485 RepID=A0A9W6B8D3_9CHLO|nr:Protein TIC 20-II [Pleodorina starrii]GLC47711.1 Protein TIC 20-II, chloroplastic [Pleodorina starrii]GLC70877.1 Protein TIC 20-II [Pleodorina starrii]